MSEPSNGAARVARLLADGAERAEQLLAVLRTEIDALEGADPQALEDAAEAKQALLGDFEAVGTVIAQTLRAAGLEDASDVERWLREHPKGPVADGLVRLRAVLAECRHANARNGAIVRQLTRHNRQLLSIISGEIPGTSVYGQDGRARQGTATRYAARA